MSSYKGIIFPKETSFSFGEFKELYASSHIFKEIPHKQREAELKKAFKIYENGKLFTGSKKSKKANISEGKK